MVDENHPINSIQPEEPATNPSEAYLDKLARRSFLSLWSYPRIYRDQKDNPKANQGAEVVDLMVVFGHTLILFSDKWCKFGNSLDLQTNWLRWKRRAIDKSIAQLFGAERWIRNFPDRLYVDKACTKKLPIKLPAPSNLKIHRVAIANGAAESCRITLGGSGSLMVSSAQDKIEIPFMVSHPSDKENFVHVLDETTFDILLKELDTISDFVHYLEKKELAITNGCHLTAAGEEELLAHYLKDVNSQGQHDFRIPKGAGMVSFDQGFWDDFVKSEARKSRIKANEVSYTWDDLIEKFNYHALTDTLYTSPGFDEHEQCLRVMASETRTRRRFLSQSLYNVLGNSRYHERCLRLASSEDGKYPTYVFLTLHRSVVEDYAEYRRIRQEILKMCCQIAVLVDRTAREVVGIGLDNWVENGEMSEDLVYLDCSNVGEDFLKEAAELRKITGFFTDTSNQHRGKVKEYPTQN